jgi:hypothetical protein
MSLMVFVGMELFAASLGATPSGEVVIPSVDCQKFGTVHLNFDSYFRVGEEANGIRNPPMIMIGPTVGVSPLKSLQAEVGFDLMFMGIRDLDQNPLYFHGKLAVPEDVFFAWAPALAVGAYNIGLKEVQTPKNLGYGLLARTIPLMGRFSLGYYYALDNLLLDAQRKDANHGFLASWDRTMKEISEKLWLAVDYLGGKSFLGSVNFCAMWFFAENVGVIFGYDLYLNRDLSGQDTVNIQVDINL